MLCQFATQHDAAAQTREETRTQAMIEVLQEQRAQSEMNQFAHRKGQFPPGSEQGDRVVGLGDSAVVLLGLSLILAVGYAEWSQSSQNIRSLHAPSIVSVGVQRPADVAASASPTGLARGADSSRLNLLAKAKVHQKPDLIAEPLHRPRIESETTSKRTRPVASMTSGNSDCDLLRYLVCEHAKLRVTIG